VVIEELELALKLASPVRVAVDAGAHFGDWTRRLLTVGAEVHAIEPCPFNRAHLVSGVGSDPRAQTRLHVHDFALSDENGEADMYTGCPSTVPSIDPRWPAREFAKDYVDPSLKVRVVTKTWATFCRDAGIVEVDLLKLDCEGMDARILFDVIVDGPYPRVIVAEVCTVGDLGEELARAEVGLTMRGYRAVQDFGIDGNKGRWNRLYVREGKP